MTGGPIGDGNGTRRGCRTGCLLAAGSLLLVLACAAGATFGAWTALQ